MAGSSEGCGRGVLATRPSRGQANRTATFTSSRRRWRCRSHLPAPSRRREHLALSLQPAGGGAFHASSRARSMVEAALQLLSGATVGHFERRGRHGQCSELWLGRRPLRRPCFARGHHLRRLDAEAARHVLCHARLVSCVETHALAVCARAYLSCAHVMCVRQNILARVCYDLLRKCVAAESYVVHYT